VGDPLTSLEGGAGVGSGLGKGYKSPPPSAPLNRGPQEARGAPGGRSSRLLPGTAAARSGLRGSSAAVTGRRAARIIPGSGCLLAGAAERGSRAAGQECGAGGGGALEDRLGRLGSRRGEHGHQASRPRRTHHGQLLGHRGPAVRAARLSVSHR
jgi:hypothetical protein